MGFEQTHDCRPLRTLTIVDEYTRKCPAVGVARRPDSEDVLGRLAELSVRRGTPTFLRSYHGAESAAKAVREWLSKLGVETLSIEPGSPWENGYVESCNGELRDMLLSRETFCTLREVQVLIERWLRECSTVRPHSALGCRPPAPEAVRLPPTSASLRSATSVV